MPYHSASPTESAAGGARANGTPGSGADTAVESSPFRGSDVGEVGSDSDTGPPPSTGKRGKQWQFAVSILLPTHVCFRC